MNVTITNSDGMCVSVCLSVCRSVCLHVSYDDVVFFNAFMIQIYIRYFAKKPLH